MDLTYDKSIIEKVRGVSSEFDEKYWRDIYRKNEFPNEYWNSLANADLFGLVIPPEFGGTGNSLLDLVLGTAETAERYSGIASYLFLSGCLVSTVFSKSSIKQKKEILPKLAKGELKISLALSEEKAGLEATSLETKAEKTSRGYRITGSKVFVNNVDNADYLIVFARTNNFEQSEKKSAGISMFLVETEGSNIVSKKLDKMGMDFIHSYDVEFHDLEVKDSALVGELHNGWYNAVESFNMDRLATAASLVGTGKLALNAASLYAKQRIVFGKYIGSNQGIQFPLAEAAAQIITAETIVLKAATMFGNGQNFLQETNLALYESLSAATYATDRALQTFGGHGYYKDYDVERYWRDVRVHKIHPISEELLLSSIAERSLGLPKSY
jgi:acyl-CoA dehydrogenase